MDLNIIHIGLITLFIKYVVATEKILMCYYGTWATYRDGIGKFDVENINPHLCTHIVYSFVGITDEGLVVSLDPFLDLSEDWGRDNFRVFNHLKQTNPELKTILAVGGWNEGSAKYSVMANDPALRKNFVTSALQMTLDHGFDGFDIDWEYPNQRDSVHGEADIDNFTQLVKELKQEFEKHGLLVTAAVSAVEDSASLSYDIPEICKYLDLVSLMTYDMYGSWDAVTGHNAPLHRGEGDEGADRTSLYTVDVAVEFWLEQGCSSSKLLIGLPFYGRTFLLTDVDINGVRAPNSGDGISGPFTATDGMIGYNEFCDILRTEPWDKRYDSLAKVPYAVQDRNWVSYDDVDSLSLKVDYALRTNVAGVLVWTIDTDDFRGICFGDEYPLLRAVKEALERVDVTTESTVTISEVTTPSTPTTLPTTDPSTTNPPTTDPPTTDPPIIEPPSTEPSIIDPSTTEPSTIDQSTDSPTDPSPTDPPMTELPTDPTPTTPSIATRAKTGSAVVLFCFIWKLIRFVP